jgi:hypothetical protein
MFLDLQAGGGTLDFLRKIEFVFRDRTHVDLPDGTEVVVIVEAGFAEFGWPDAILVANTPTGGRMVFFLEAKAGMYRNEAQDYTKRDRGFNSKINGQFTLRYRLSRALQSFRGDHPRLSEPQTLAAAYGEETPRRLSKPENLEHIVRPHLVGACSYFFVALTDDVANVWQDLEFEKPSLLPYLAEPTLGFSVTPEATWSLERNAWSNHRDSFGWIGFRQVEDLLCGGSFFPHAQQFLHAKRRISLRTVAGTSFTNRATKNWELYRGGATLRLRDRIRAIIKGSPPVQDGYLRYQEESGSDSVIDLRDQRVLKLISPIRPYDAFDILFGLSIDIGGGFPADFRAMSQGVIGINNRGFEIVGLSEGAFGEDALAEVILDTVANVIDPAEIEG